MKKHKFKRRVWLNSQKSASTGSLVIYHGESPWEKGEYHRFIEIASCNEIARLHMTNLDTNADWIFKVEKLTENLQDYLEFLKKHAD